MSMPAVEPGVDDDDDYLALVRAAVFALRHKRCFDAAQLRELYASTHENRSWRSPCRSSRSS